METRAAVVNGLSFDVEDWFHAHNYSHALGAGDLEAAESRVISNTDTILGVLEKHSVRATFFVLGCTALRHPELIIKLIAGGHEIGSHGHLHRPLTQLDPIRFKEDLNRSLDALDKAGATDVRGFRAPSFSLVSSTLWAFDVIAECGLEYDSSVFPTGLHPTYGLRGVPLRPYQPRKDLWEIPLTVVPLFGRNVPVAGGGYFRLYPYRLTEWATRRVNADGRAAVVYLHPWEFDPDQPSVSVPYWRRLRQRVGLKHTATRLDRLLEGFRFSTLGELLEVHRGLR